MAAQADPLKKPASAYFLWFNSKREEIQAQLNTKDLGTVGKKGGEMWKTLPASEKSRWEKKAKEQKDAYDKFIATPEGQKALEEKKAGKRQEKDDKQKKVQEREEKKAQIEEKRAAREEKQELKAVEKDDRLKKPATAYFMWFNDNREKIQQKLGTKDFGIVGKKASEMWKGLVDAERKVWEDKAKAKKDAYEKYINSEEGKVALQAYKDEVTAIKGKRAPEPDTAEETPAAKQARKGKAGA